METLIKADIFFFVSTFAVAIVAICAGIVTFYVVRILKDVKHVSEALSRESDKVAEDIDAIRSTIKEKSHMVGGLLSAVSGAWRRKKGRKGTGVFDI